MMEFHLNQLELKPWQSRYFKTPAWFSNYPTMLTVEEMRMLSWVAQKVEVHGEIVDLGCFLGGSTVSLCHGNSMSASPSKVYSYDRFVVDEKVKHTFLYQRGHSYFGGVDGRPIFEHFTSPYADQINVCHGDLLSQKWNGKNIKVLFIDLSKTLALNHFILREFFQYLTVGSIVIQQDFLFYKNPWLWSSMHALSNKIKYVASTTDYSAVFEVIEQISESDIEGAILKSSSKADHLAGIHYHKQFYTDARSVEMIDALERAVINATEDELLYAWEIKNVAKLPITFNS